MAHEFDSKVQTRRKEAFDKRTSTQPVYAEFGYVGGRRDKKVKRERDG